MTLVKSTTQYVISSVTKKAESFYWGSKNFSWYTWSSEIFSEIVTQGICSFIKIRCWFSIVKVPLESFCWYTCVDLPYNLGWSGTYFSKSDISWMSSSSCFLGSASSFSSNVASSSTSLMGNGIYFSMLDLNIPAMPSILVAAEISQKSSFF